MTRIDLLEKAKADIAAGVDEAITTLKGSVEFRDAVEELLAGTPYAKPADAAYDFEGLYGRLRNALRQASVSSAQGEGWRAIESAPKDGRFLVADALGRIMVMDGRMLAASRWPHTPEHLSGSHWTHWIPLPNPPLSAVPRRDADTE